MVKVHASLPQVFLLSALPLKLHVRRTLEEGRKVNTMLRVSWSELNSFSLEYNDIQNGKGWQNPAINFMVLKFQINLGEVF